MMTKLEIVARQALEALKDYHKADDDRVSVAMSILQEALAEQAEQEPVAWRCTRNDISDINYVDDDESLKYFERRNYDIEPLYAAPVSIAKQSETDSSSSSMRTTVRTKDLTDDEIVNAAGIGAASEGSIMRFRAVIAADREKNK